MAQTQPKRRTVDANASKDPSIIRLLDALKASLGPHAFDIVDHWKSDLFAVGIACPNNHGVLAYMSTYGQPDGRYSVSLELPPQPGDDAPYTDAGKYEVQGIEALSEVIRRHFQRGNRPQGLPNNSAHTAPVQIQRTLATEHTLVRKLRLAALRDAPDAFGETLNDAMERPDEYWIELTDSLAKKHAMFTATVEGAVRGSVFGIRDDRNPNGGRLGGMWVDSAYRRRGLGLALLEAVVDWATSQGFDAVRLWVPVHSPRAKSLYLKASFKPTGITSVAESTSPFEIEEMILTLPSA